MASVASIPCAATISFDEAQAIVRGSSVPLGTQFVPIGTAGRQTLARDMVALIDSPRRGCAAMDGYAVRSDDLAQAVVQFRLAGESCSSGPSPEPLPIGIAVRISTGTPMPAGADRVVMREYADVEGGNVIRSVSGQHRYALRCTQIWSVAVGPWVMAQCFLLSTGGRRASQLEKYKRRYRSFRSA